VRGGYFYLATSGYLELATRGYFFMATDTCPWRGHSWDRHRRILVRRVADAELFGSVIEIGSKVFGSRRRRSISPSPSDRF
jgi:hypothetical protein